MNTNPNKHYKEDHEVNCGSIQAIDNKLEKEQKSGDATKISSGGRLTIVKAQESTVTIPVEYHEMVLDGETLRRNGEKIGVRLSEIQGNKKRVEVYKEALKEEQENNRISSAEER